MIFLSARSAVTGNNAQGYYQVTPLDASEPANGRRTIRPHSRPISGAVVPRLSHQRAVAAILDGHVEKFDLKQMQDMRHWCNRADRADWTLTQ